MPRYSSEAAFSSSPLSAPASSPRKPIFVDESESDADRGVGRMELEDEEGSEQEGEDEAEEEDSSIFEVESIIARKGGGTTGRRLMYKIRWKGYTAADDTWEPVDSIQAVDLIKAFEDKVPEPVYAGTKKRSQSQSASVSGRSQRQRQSSIASSSREPLDRSSKRSRSRHSETVETLLYRTPTKIAQEWIIPMSKAVAEPVFSKIRNAIDASASTMLAIHPATLVKLRTTTTAPNSTAVNSFQRAALKESVQLIEENKLALLSHLAFPSASPLKTQALFDIVKGRGSYALHWPYGIIHWEDEFYHLLLAAYTLRAEVDAFKKYRVLVRKIKPNMQLAADRLGVELVDIAGFFREAGKKKQVE